MNNLILNENSFISHDKTPIYYKSWENKQSKNAIILLHRGHEHSGRIAHLVDELDLDDMNFFAWDARGNGQTEGKRGYAPDFSFLVKDLDFFVKHINKKYDIPVENMILIAQSVGSVVASAWIHDYAPKIKGVVLASPAFNINLIIPGAKQLLQLWQKIKGDYVVKSYVKGKDLTHDLERSTSYHTDPLICFDIYSNVLLELYEHANRVVQDAGAIVTPVLLLTSGDDKVVFKKEQEIFFHNLSSKIKEHHIFDGFYHDTLGEKDRKIAIDLIKKFIVKINTIPNHINLIDADKKGYTYDEYKELQKNLPTFGLKNVQFGLIKFGLKNIGKYLSEGISIAEKTGHDSGSTLDYVYKNQPQGNMIIGKMIDTFYLESIGWKGIRIRKIHLGKMIEFAISQLKNQNQEIKILDIAAGHGRYILDAVLPYKDSIKSILLRDYSDINVDAGGRLIVEKGLGNIAKFINGNAFDGESIAQLEIKPTLGIVSGLYELFSENALLQNSLNGLYRAIENNGYLIYTNQPWHPQVELIARTLTSHRNGEAWIMRRRTQAEIDCLVEQAGFKKIDQYIDKWGIFSVSIAKKI